MNEVLKWVGIYATAVAGFLALWIAAHGGLKSAATVAAEVAADAAELRSQQAGEQR